MNLRWCAFTGVLMLVSVGATFLHQEAVKDPPGVVTRWWDGTMQTVDTFHSNGRIRTHTEYSDDGKTILVYKQLTRDGVVVHEKIRLEDGNLEDKTFAADGKTLRNYTLWFGDESYFLVQRSYFDTGKLASEVIKTEDGKVTQTERIFNEDGSLAQEFFVNRSAAQESKEYNRGVLISHSVLHGSHDRDVFTFYPDGSKRSVERTIKLNGESTFQLFNRRGQLLAERYRAPDGEFSTNKVYNSAGQITLEQRFDQVMDPVEVIEYAPATGLPTRKLTINLRESLITVSRYRADGTLHLVKEMQGGNIVRQRTYDAEGKTVVADIRGGEPEIIANSLFNDASRSVYPEGER